MASPNQHFRKIKHYNDPGDVHELTFSCHDRMPLLTNDLWRKLLSESVDRALNGHNYFLVAFVFMPEHVHLLVYPGVGGGDIRAFLYAIKRPYSYRIKELLQASHTSLLSKLTVTDRRKGVVFRYWQKGPGYDRNLNTNDVIRASIDYIHLNPVRRGLCQRASDWKWSSARWYETDRKHKDPELPTIHGLPAEFF